MENLVYNSYILSDKGLIRDNNEDNYFFDGIIKEMEAMGSNGILTSKKNGKGIFAVFDGLGGEDRGELASYLCSETLKNMIDNGEVDENHGISNFYQQANIEVLKATRKERLHICGSTAVIAVVNNSAAYLSNIGDSKCFLIRDGDILQLSNDHTDEQFLLSQGIVNRKPRLTQCIGMSEEYGQIEPSYTTLDLVHGDKLILCSDGITDMVSTDFLCMAVDQHNSIKAIEEIEKVVLKNGAKDNYTLILISIE